MGTQTLEFKESKESFYSADPEIILQLPQTDGYFSRENSIIEKFSFKEKEYGPPFLHPI